MEPADGGWTMQGGTERGRGAVEGSVEQGARGKERKRLGRRERATGWYRERKGWSRWE